MEITRIKFEEVKLELKIFYETRKDTIKTGLQQGSFMHIKIIEIASTRLIHINITKVIE